MKYTDAIKRAIKFSIKTHEVYQKQKRKGKDIPYITHPLTVGIILSLAGATEEVIISGILHDTIEDSINEKKVDKKMINDRFGEKVTKLVLSVTEKNKKLPWEKRKKEAIKHIAKFSQESLLLKSADILSNTNELIDDYNKNGERVFSNFNASKNKILKNYLETISTILSKWKENPLKDDLKFISEKLQMIGAIDFMIENRAKIIKYEQYKESLKLKCPICKWQGTIKESGCIEYYDQLLNISCPICDKMLLIVNYPAKKEGLEKPKKEMSWDNYDLFILKNRLNWIKTQNPKIYNYYDKNGHLKSQTSDNRQLKRDKKRYTIKIANNKKEISEIEKRIKLLKNKIKKSKI